MIVFDCSAAVKMTRATSCGLGFRCLILENERVIASELFRAEVRNTFWKYVRAGFLPFDEAEAVRQNHPVYDFFYLTLARRNAATLCTADKKLVALCESMGVNCIREG